MKIISFDFISMDDVQNQLVGAYEGHDITLHCVTEAFPKSINYWTFEKGEIVPQSEFDSILSSQLHGNDDDGYSPDIVKHRVINASELFPTNGKVSHKKQKRKKNGGKYSVERQSQRGSALVASPSPVGMRTNIVYE